MSIVRRRLWFVFVLVGWIVPAALLCAGEITSQEKAEGFVSLFDGTSLKGWTGATDGYEARDGAIVCNQKKGGNLFTEQEFSDFVLRLDVKIPPGGNNGIAIRSPNQTGSVAYAGMEIQVLDDPHPMYKTIKPYQFHGSVYGIVPAKPGSLKPAGEWNEEEITVKGRRIKIVVNGKTVVDADLDQASKNGTVDGKDHPGLKRASGHIGFLGHGSAVEFRNLRIKDLKAHPESSATSSGRNYYRPTLLSSLRYRVRRLIGY